MQGCRKNSILLEAISLASSLDVDEANTLYVQAQISTPANVPQSKN